MNTQHPENIRITAADIRTAQEVHLYKNSTLFVVIGNRAYGFREGGSAWFPKENLWDYLDSDLMMTCFTHITREEAAQLYMGWTKDPAADCMRLNEAIKFAVDHHAGQFRKATVRPYISHPLETLVILQSMDADIDLQIAGVLHDTLEDTDATAEEIRALFGDDVVRLVTAHSEDKSKTWDERKASAIEELSKADTRLKMLVMADKVSNLRSMAFDYARVGKALWNRFNAPISKQAWYYSGIQDALSDMQNDPACAAVYWEMVGLYKDLFVRFFYDTDAQSLYQVCADGTRFRLDKGDPEWKPDETRLPSTAKRVERAVAEKTEDDWSAPFWETHGRDMEDARYPLFASGRRAFDICITDRELVLHCEDLGPECEVMTGRNDYEFFIRLPEEDTHRFLVRLRLNTDLDTPLGELLKNHFGEDDGPQKFEAFCTRSKIEFQRFCL